MRIRQELAQVRLTRESVLTIGVFDGVHLGHQSLIGLLRGLAQSRGLLSGVITFDRHPLEVLAPDDHPTYLTSLEQRLTLLQRQGPDFLLAISFTPEVAQLEAGEFLGLLQEYLKVKGLVVGPDFVMGKGRGGDIDTLRALGEREGFFVEVVPPLVFGGKVVSSTAIRHALAQGDMADAALLLGRPFTLEGPVVSGASRGRFLGYPTANLSVDHRHALPPDGVYAARTFVGAESYGAAAYVGRRPTFGETERLVEVFLLDFQGDLYGQALRVEFLERLRPDMTFPSAGALQAQIKKDVARIRAILEETRG
ncbi:MAG: bifunctional riboflavin kinase/FAD synthetase [Chloroflexi bacterium]|nr:bifunctional riboflavin kinase/FAD synthetase [Chloroflexota bacterium]